MRSESDRMIKKNPAARAVAVLTIALMLFTSFGVTDGSFAAKKSRIVYQNINNNFVLQKGRKYKVRVRKYGKAAKHRVRFKSSNKRVATVSRRGVIKARRNGTAKITAYVLVKGKKKYKKTVRIRVGKRVRSVSVTGEPCVRVGKSITLKKKCYPAGAKNKKVRWYSSNNSVARVSSKGKVRGIREGYARIYAKAADGSRVFGSVRVHVYRGFRRSDTRWIAHRGLHVGYAENTAGAFIAAGKAGFWGTECDVRETKHVKVPVQPDPADVDEGEEPPQPEYVEDFDLVISHDETFKRVFGVSSAVKDMTADAIRNNSKLKGRVCFLHSYLEICYLYNMVPVIEIKDRAMSDPAIKKMADMVWDAGVQNGGGEEAGRAFLKKVNWISFYPGNLKKVKDYISGVEEYGLTGKAIMTTYLINTSDKQAALKAISLAKRAGNDFNAVSIDKNDLFPAFVTSCKRNGLQLDVWSFRNKARDISKMHYIMKHSGYGPTHISVDFRPWP